MRSIHLPFARWVTSFLSTFFLLLPSAHAAGNFMHRKRLRLWFIHVIHRFIHNMLITLFITMDNSPQKIAMLPWNADTVEVPVMWIVWITRNGAQGGDSANSLFIKKQVVSYACRSFCFTLSTRQTTVAVCRQSDDSDDQTESLWDFLSDWKNSEQQHAFLHSNIEESTFHHLRWSPSLSREENVLHAFLCSNIQHSTFHHSPAKTGLSIVWKSKIS